ncbi:DUF1583 domain-containing protein [Rhodopirellula sp. P2]|uniref:DUF1583 domain-containing protein n=1 Tax=Rhodopirellula sp. P2 TaxID=2127060 RepID=UPI002367C0D4|nr:DUF1583 domain-containing protein [Rhodopirellula sp. P2]WDQ14696.1 DUF1583 domain-containing protein [Rhodopirellula sp. P2]
MNSQARFQLISIVASVFVLLLIGISRAANAGRSDTSAMEILFARELDVLAQGSDGVVLQASKLAPVDRFTVLADWVLPSETRPNFRMQSRFVQIAPIANSEVAPKESIVEGITSPAFYLLAAATETNRLAELRRRVQAIPDPLESDQMRAKLALLFMIEIADFTLKSPAKVEESTSAMLASLATHVRTRDPAADRQAWPEILALAYGMHSDLRSSEFLELVTSVYSVQIENLSWDANAAWDVYAFGAFAGLDPSNESDPKLQTVSPSSFESWQQASVVSANSRGNGFTAATWRPVGNAVHKFAGHNNDYLYFPSPLTGDFEIECDVTGFHFGETQVAYAGIFASPHSSRSQAEIGGLRSQEMLPLDPPMSPPDDWMSCRISVRDGVCRHFINGRSILQRTLVDGQFPWVALRAHRLSHGGIRNLTITGSPEIPSSIDMVNSPKLVGWYSYYDEPVDDPKGMFAWRSVATQETESSFEVQHAARRELAGSNLESLLMYHRPLMEDGSIEYEFFYAKGETAVHPAIDRLAFLLEPDGVQVHWVTDGAHQPGNLSPANRAFVTKQEQRRPEVVLKDNSWNRVRLELRGDDVLLLLNGKPVMDRALKPWNQRQFGLFHFADKTNARVRNLRWSGDWQNAEEVLGKHRGVRPDTAEMERLTSALPQSYRQDFRNLEIDSSHFIQRGGPITVGADGIAMKASGSQSTDLPLWLEVRGDFDLRARFENFQHADVGDGALEMLAYLPSDGQKIRVARHRWDNKEQKLRTRFSPMTDAGHQAQRARDHWAANEATSGVFRMVRLGTTVHYLFAENDSETFRLLSTDEVGRGPLSAGGITLKAFAEKGGSASTTWTNISVRAEQIEGVAVQDMQALRSQLDDSKKLLKKSFVHDFTEAAPDPETFSRLNDTRPWNEADDGLRLRDIGKVDWGASVLIARIPVEGDFDIRLEFDELKLASAGNGQQAILAIEVQPTSEPRTTVNSMLGLNSPGVIQAEGYARVRMPDGSQWFNGTERHTVTSATALRIARRGERFFMMVRAEGEQHDRIVSMSDHSDAPINGIIMMLRSGGAGSESSVRLKKFEVHSGEQ